MLYQVILLLFARCGVVAAWTTAEHRPRSCARLAMMSDSSAALRLLYQDQQKAMLRRSEYEETLIPSPIPELEAPALKDFREKGAGFGGGKGKTKPKDRAAARWVPQQVKILQRDGVLRIDRVLTPELADRLRTHVLEQQVLAERTTTMDPSKSRAFYGVEQARANRCDLQLSLLRGGFAADTVRVDSALAESSPHVVADVLQELLGRSGTLRPIYEALVTPRGELYELATVVTDPGSDRQMMHPDLPFRDPAPLYVIFLALQHVTADMGPTCFLLQTHTAAENAKFAAANVTVQDQQLRSASARLATLRRGDAVLFDARILHCGTANHPETGSTRAMFNFSFRNPGITGSLGYEGSIRPGYCQAMTLEDVGLALASYQEGELEPFGKYGSGLL